MADVTTIRQIAERHVELLARRPDRGLLTCRTRARRVAGLRCEIEEGPWRLAADMPRKIGGEETGPTPGVLGRAALASCLVIGVSAWSARLGIELGAVEVEVETDFDARGELGMGEVEPGYSVIAWALEPEHGIAVLAAVLVLRCAATVFTIAGGGVAGVFIPLVVAGALSGRIVGGVVNELDVTLFVVVGIAAFLGAGYRVPLASVMFVAETTGRASIVVPGLFAAVMAELMMGASSVTNLQRAARVATGASGD